MNELNSHTSSVPNGPSGATVIEPGGGWQALNLRELWRFRELIYFFVWRDVKVRYKQTVLGAAWAIIQPLMLMFVFTLFVGKLAGVAGADDRVVVYAGMVAWTFFATAMGNAGASVVNSERLITKIYFPRLAVPLSAVGAAVVDFLIASALLVVMMIFRGARPGMSILMLPLIVALIALAATGLGTLLAALTVAYRDFRYVVPFLVQFLLFATPSVYLPNQSVPLRWDYPLVAANPMNALVASFKACLFDLPIPWPLLASSTLLIVVLFGAGCFYFRRVEDSFADIV
jgi:lipopolysaccharide transport system permease protein